LLLAAWLLVRAYKNPRLLTVFASGLMIGVSCLFRSNTLLLPLFVCGVTPLLFKRGFRLRFAATFLLGFLLLIVPVTIRNAVYFHSFIPVSLSAGITLVEGIGVYDKEKRFGLPDNDYLVSKWEAQEFGRPDYLGDRFGVDGVIRERYRVKRGLAVITSHPSWFMKVMAQRAASMLRLARVELVRPQLAVRSSLFLPSDAVASWTIRPIDQTNQPNQPGAALRIEGSSRNFFSSKPASVIPHTEYLLRVPIRIERGALVLEVLDRQLNTLARSPVLHPVNWLDLTEKQQPEVIVELPFVSGEATDVEIRVDNGGRLQEQAAAELGSISAYKLGPASQTWTRYPRVVVRLLQKLFITAIFLPLTLLGAFLLISRRRWPQLAILLIVPIYYMCVQSALWTEFRYILAMHYFLFILAAMGFVWAGSSLASLVTRSSTKSSADGKV